jgi:radical SAM-linked protein
MSQMEAVQRIRLVFAKGGPVKYVAHLALMRAWERIVRRAGLPIAYSQGFNPRPRLTFASALPVGYTGRAEVMDVELTTRVAPQDLLERVRPQLPAGFGLESAGDVPLRSAPLQALVRYSVYRVGLGAAEAPEVVQQALARLLATENVPWQREVKGRRRDFDLRALVRDLWYIGPAGDRHWVGMALVTDNTASGRPGDVLDLLGLGDRQHVIERVRLVFDGEALLESGLREGPSEV